MARGDFVKFEEFSKSLGDGDHDLGSDTFALILITTLPTAADATPDRADYTECSAGGSYSTGGIVLTGVTYTEAGGVSTFDSTLDLAWAQAASSPTNVVAGLLVNNTHAGSNDAIGFIDITVDGGSTPVSMVDNPINVTWNASGILTVT